MGLTADVVCSELISLERNVPSALALRDDHVVAMVAFEKRPGIVDRMAKKPRGIPWLAAKWTRNIA